MTNLAPLIGVSTGSRKLPDSGASILVVRPSYTRAVAAAGGAPVMIPIQIDAESLRSIFNHLDGLVITGGGDIDPARYGAEPSVYTAGVDPDRDEAELLLARWAVEENKPLLGICRGHQILNVALGGTLTQDIRAELPGALRHDNSSDEWFGRFAHEVSVTTGSQLSRVLGIDGSDRLSVNSLHHQAVGRPGERLKRVACADDGVVEGMEVEGCDFVLSVQWHPEGLYEQHPPHRRLFEALVSAARRT